MAEFHYHRQVTNRTGKDGQVRNAVAMAAYIRAEQRVCERTEVTVNWRQKADEVIFKHCFLPADAPEWALVLYGQGNDAGTAFSEVAWNMIERLEKRVDAQLCFHDDMAIPIELNQTQAIELVKGFVQETLAINGVFCDVAIHWDEGNPHVHVLMPCLRVLTDEGFSRKRRIHPSVLRQEVLRIRAAWAQHANAQLQTYGHNARIDHRSYADRGIALTPTQKIGKATHMHGSDIQIRRIAENQAIRARNYAAIIDDPQVLVNKISERDGVVSEAQLRHELGRYVVDEQVLSVVTAGKTDNASTAEAVAIANTEVNTQTATLSIDEQVQAIIRRLSQDHGVFNEKLLQSLVLEQAQNKTQFEAVLNKVYAHKGLVALGLGEDGRVHYTTRSYFALEKHLIAISGQLATATMVPGTGLRGLPTAQTVSRVAQQEGLNSGQQIALAHLMSDSRLNLVVGVAGSGKTSRVLKQATALWGRAGYRVIGVAPSGRAAAGLAQETGMTAYTIAKLRELVKYDQLTLNRQDVLVVDEAGMVSLDDMQTVLTLAEAAGCAVKAVGDTAQLQPVARGAPMRAMLAKVGGVRLETVLRQQVDWMRAATLAMETQKVAEGLSAYVARGCVQLVNDRETAAANVVQAWNHGVLADSDNLHQHLMLAHQNSSVQLLNQLARAQLIAAKIITPLDGSINTAHGQLALALGERLLFRKNDYRLGVKNGQFGTLMAVKAGQLVIKLDDTGEEVSIDPETYPQLQYGYAATVHSAQGITVDKAVVWVDSRGWDRHLALVAASRHRSQLTLVTDRKTFNETEDLVQVLSREGLSDTVLDYPLGFALRRGFESGTMIRQTIRWLQGQAQTLHDGWLWLTHYQAYLQSQALQRNDSIDSQVLALQQRRQQAVIVADFCDLRAKIAQGYRQLRGVTAHMTDKISSEVDLNMEQRAQLRQTLYDWQWTNSQRAEAISTQRQTMEKALAVNRVPWSAIEKAQIFGQRRAHIAALQQAVSQGYGVSAKAADELLANIKVYYPHLVALLPHKVHRRDFLQAITPFALNRRYEQALMQWGVGYRKLINTAKHYAMIEQQLGPLTRQLNAVISMNEKTALQTRVNHLWARRALLASQLARYDEEGVGRQLFERFDIDSQRVARHAQQYARQLLVKQLQQQWQLGQALSVDKAIAVVEQLKRYYPAIVSVVADKVQRRQFIQAVKQVTVNTLSPTQQAAGHLNTGIDATTQASPRSIEQVTTKAHLSDQRRVTINANDTLPINDHHQEANNHQPDTDDRLAVNQVNQFNHAASIDSTALSFENTPQAAGHTEVERQAMSVVTESSDTALQEVAVTETTGILIQQNNPCYQRYQRMAAVIKTQQDNQQALPVGDEQRSVIQGTIDRLIGIRMILAARLRQQNRLDEVALTLSEQHQIKADWADYELKRAKVQTYQQAVQQAYAVVKAQGDWVSLAIDGVQQGEVYAQWEQAWQTAEPLAHELYNDRQAYRGVFRHCGVRIAELKTDLQRSSLIDDLMTQQRHELKSQWESQRYHRDPLIAWQANYQLSKLALAQGNEAIAQQYQRDAAMYGRCIMDNPKLLQQLTQEQPVRVKALQQMMSQVRSQGWSW